jgi:catechol 2,3-dioxygenase-like lactoylglutathione lyase family enzyme
MSSTSKVRSNVKQAVPFFMVKNIDSSIKFYVNGLGFSMTERWVVQGKLKWCWLVIDTAALMLQEINSEAGDANLQEAKAGDGAEVFFICEDALAIYDQIVLNGILPSEPFVGNKMWVVSLQDPDGYKISFESVTDVPEETKYSQWKNTK